MGWGRGLLESCFTSSLYKALLPFSPNTVQQKKFCVVKYLLYYSTVSVVSNLNFLLLVIFSTDIPFKDISFITHI